MKLLSGLDIDALLAEASVEESRADHRHDDQKDETDGDEPRAPLGFPLRVGLRDLNHGLLLPSGGMTLELDPRVCVREVYDVEVDQPESREDDDPRISRPEPNLLEPAASQCVHVLSPSLVNSRTNRDLSAKPGTQYGVADPKVHLDHGPELTPLDVCRPERRLNKHARHEPQARTAVRRPDSCERAVRRAVRPG